jgi:putative transcriptional regulator
VEAALSNFFDDLVESVTQMDEIVRGKREPSRQFQADAAGVKAIREVIWLSQPRFAKILDVDRASTRK